MCVTGEETLSVLRIPGLRPEPPQLPAKGELTVHQGTAMRVQKVGPRSRLRTPTLYSQQVTSFNVKHGLEVNPAFA